MKSNEPIDATRARSADPTLLAALLADTRHHTLSTFAAYERALGPGDVAVPFSPQLNPPRWELGHIGWFQEWWLRRNPQRMRGAAADPEVVRPPPHRTGADSWFDSSRVPHLDRWQLPLPSADALRDDLARGLEDSLALLRDCWADDDALYFFRLSLFHEDMHHEAALYMAQHLGVPVSGWAPRAHARASEIVIDGGAHPMGAGVAGFAFDNELGAHTVHLGAFTIDSAPVSWARYLAFVAAGGYQHREFWSPDGWAWLQSQQLQAPRYLRPAGSTWQRLTFGSWQELDPTLPAMNISGHEAQAYCAWAGLRLPIEAEWERAAEQARDAFEWGQVWEWTASDFIPYPGFSAHPYRDYSAPWFHSRRVLRGGSFATHMRMKHPRYRNFFPPDRNDVHAGFRTCAPRS
jgi:ergothioneine biosynthesis protein EgtB